MSAIWEVSAKLLEFDTATLYEAAGQQGMVDPGIRPMWPGAHMVGVAATLTCPPADNLMLHHAVAAAVPGVVLVASADGYTRAGAWGEVLTVAAQAKGIAGLVIDGCVRDIEAIAERRFPVFARGLAIGACKKERLGTLNEPIVFGGVLVKPGDIVVGNADGIVVIDRDAVEQVWQAATERRDREREIFRQLDSGKTTIELLGLKRLPNGYPAGGR